MAEKVFHLLYFLYTVKKQHFLGKKSQEMSNIIIYIPQTFLR